jgi:hypothetical protein
MTQPTVGTPVQPASSFSITAIDKLLLDLRGDGVGFHPEKGEASFNTRLACWRVAESAAFSPPFHLLLRTAPSFGYSEYSGYGGRCVVLWTCFALARRRPISTALVRSSLPCNHSGASPTAHLLLNGQSFNYPNSSATVGHCFTFPLPRSTPGTSRKREDFLR